MSFRLDAPLFQWLYGWLHQPPWLGLMRGLTHLGDAKVVLSCAALGFLESAAARARRAVHQLPSLLAWLGIPVAIGLTGWLKEWVNRPRPAQVIPSLGLLETGVGGSFPSGHATLIFALAGVLSFRWPRGRFIWWCSAFLVALSRIALGLHWPSDVVGGAIIGVGVVVGLVWVEQRVRFAKKK